MFRWSEMVRALFRKGESSGQLSAGVVLAMALVGFLLMFGSGLFFPSAPAKQATFNTGDSGQSISVQRVTDLDCEAKYERSLQETLGSIAGAGAVTIDVFWAGSPRSEFARSLENTEKTAQDSGSAGIAKITTETRTNSQVTLLRSGSREEPLVVQTTAPVVQGVLVVAEGASNPQIRWELAKAVQTALGVPIHRVKVLPRGEK